LIIHTQYKKNLGRFQKKNLPITFSRGSFFFKQVQRKFPIQAALHVFLDGALVGVLILVAIMSSVALHSQYLWTEAFTRLEETRDLNRRLLESTSILESYLLKNQKFSRSLIQTKAEDLLYLEKPPLDDSKLLVKDSFRKRISEKISTLPIKFGY
tara:strand:+ start:112 stop:576 length:465 start_codon:yes stop_codon:yes gene_type:complete